MPGREHEKHTFLASQKSRRLNNTCVTTWTETRRSACTSKHVTCHVFAEDYPRCRSATWICMSDLSPDIVRPKLHILSLIKISSSHGGIENRTCSLLWLLAFTIAQSRSRDR